MAFVGGSKPFKIKVAALDILRFAKYGAAFFWPDSFLFSRNARNASGCCGDTASVQCPFETCSPCISTSTKSRYPALVSGRLEHLLRSTSCFCLCTYLETRSPKQKKSKYHLCNHRFVFYKLNLNSRRKIRRTMCKIIG